MSEAHTVRERPLSAAKWSESDLRAEIERAKAVAEPSGVAVAQNIVRFTHDVTKLARRDARVPLADVVALVAAQPPRPQPLYRRIRGEGIIGWYEYEKDSNSLSRVSLVGLVLNKGYRGNEDAPPVV